MTLTPRFVPTALQPTTEQTAIQVARERIVLVEANAGAAKTTTLCLRAGEALALGVAATDMLALVFTEEAREVMRQRLLELGIAPALAAQVRVETFEAFATTVLREIEGVDTPRLTMAAELRPYVEQAIGQASDKYRFRYDSLEIATHNLAISQFLDSQLSAKARMTLAKDWEDAAFDEIAELAGMPLTQLLTLTEYETLRLGMYDEARFRGPFDATYDLARYLDSRPECAEALPNCRLLLCDELHDMNEATFRILTALLDKGRGYFVGAGDKDQVIHATLGADAAFLRERFDAHFQKVCRLPLSASYRHGAYLALAMGKFKNKPSASGLDRQTDIKRLSYHDGDWPDAGRLAVKAIKDWQHEHGASAESAILIRDTHQSIAIENALLQAGIAYRCQGMQAYLQRSEILFMRGMLAIALNNLASVGAADIRAAIVEALVTFAGVDLSETYFLDVNRLPDHQAALAKTKKIIADDPAILGDFFQGQFKKGRSARIDRTIDTVAYLRTLPADAEAHTVLQEISQRMSLATRIKQLYVHPQQAAVVEQSVNGFIALAAEAGLSLSAFAEKIGSSEAQLGKRRSKHPVILERVETAKGKEYEHVILPFLEKGEFPRTGALLSEEENLFYVGATRTKNRLTLLCPTSPALHSPFIARLGLGAAMTAKASVASEHNANQATAAGRIDLNVPYAAKDKAKALGARWDPVRRIWFVEAGTDLAAFHGWVKD